MRWSRKEKTGRRGSRFFPGVNRVALTLILSLVAGCGGDDHPVPPKSTVVIGPQSVTWDIPQRQSPCPYDPALYVDQVFVIRVEDSDSVPLGGVDLRILTSLSGNTSSGVQEALRLYDDYNGNGVVDDPEELVSGNGAPAYFTKTEEFSAEKSVIVRINLSCAFRGMLEVSAGGFYGNAQMQVVEVQQAQ